MRKTLLLVFFAFSSLVSANTYYVSTTGKDTNEGTINSPWATWEKAISAARPGDVVYFRSGIYYMTNAIHIHPDNTPNIGYSGTEGNYITYCGYPDDVAAGNMPIFDYSKVNRPSYWNEAMSLEDAFFLSFKDLVFRNVWQKYNGVTRSGVQAQGIQALYCANLKFERITVHNIGGRAFGYFGGFTTEPGGNRIPSMKYDSTYFINCDVYDLCDSICTTTDATNCAEAHIGGWADGIKVDSWVGAYVLIKGCRAWHFGDNGFDISSSGHTVVDNCWAWRGGDFHFTSLNGPFDGEGSGIKYGGLSEGDTTTILIDEIKNCISTYNLALGFDENNSYSWTLPVHCHVFNNISYFNNIGFGNFSYTTGRKIRSQYSNNISYKDKTYARGCEMNCDINESFNSWDSASCGRPVLERIPITDADFISLDTSQLRRPRKADGSLPDITFLHLAPTSDAKNAGKNVGMPFNDSAPDLGPFETDSSDPDFKAVSSITVTGSGGAKTISTDNGTLQLSADVLPFDATDKTVTWSISSGTDKAKISSSGLVTAFDNGTAVAKATANDGSGVCGTLTITITNQVIPVTSITVTGAGNASTITTDNGTLQLYASVLPTNATNKTITWSISSGTDKATISTAGLVTALDNGTIFARAATNDGSGISGTLTITISNQVIPVTSVTVTGAGGATAISSDNGILQLSAAILPFNATNKTVTWSISSGTDKASISSTGLVTAIDNGTVIARATANDGSGKNGTLTITISNQVILVSGITVTGTGGASLITVIGGTLQLSANILPSNATNKAVTWSISSGADKASISATGLVTALGNGTAVARATTNDGSGVYGNLTITVSDQIVPVTSITITGAGGVTTISTDNGTLQLNASILPSNATNKTVSWSISSGTDKASISSTGLVAALDNGTAVIKATANDGSGVFVTLTITVLNQVSSINTPPVATVNFHSGAYSGFVYDLDASGSYDSNKDDLTFTWQTPLGISVSSTTGSHIKYLAPVVSTAHTYEFAVNVTDGKATTSKTIGIKIMPYKPELEVADITNVEASSFQSPYYPYNIIDGNIGTMWSANGDNQWLIVQLKKLFSVQHIKLAFQYGQKNESYFDILGSVDKITWDPILSKSASCGFSGDIQVFDFPASKTGNEYNYIKIIGHGNEVDAWNFISELKIFGYLHNSLRAYENLPVKIYPNPARENVCVRIDESSLMPDYIMITSMSGGILLKTKIDPEEREFSYPVNLKNGIYLLQLLSGKLTVFSQKLVISK